MNIKEKHHSSIYDNTTTTLLTTRSCSAAYPVVIIELRATGVAASQTSGSPINHIIRKKRIRTKIKKMESLMSKNMRKIMKYSVTIQDISCEFGLALKRKKKSFRKRGVIKTSQPKISRTTKYIMNMTLKVNYQLIQY